MNPDITSSITTSLAALSLGARHVQPAPPAGAFAPSIQSRPELPASSFAENNDFTDAPGWFDAAALDALSYQLRQLKAPDSANLPDIVRLFSSIKESAAEIGRALWQAPDGAPVSRLSEALVAFLRQFNHALGQQPELCDSLDASDIRSLCLGLSVCASPDAGVIFDKAQQRRIGPALQGVTKRLLTQLSVLGMPEAASANGVVLDILNWISRGLKSELLEANDAIRGSYGQALGLFAGWLGSDHSRGFLSVHQLAKCAVQIDLMVKRTLVPLEVDTKQGAANRALLKQCAMGLGSQAALAQLDTGSASSSSSVQRTVDAVPLINLCNALRTLLDRRVLQADDSTLTAPLSRLLGLILWLTPQQLCAGDSKTLSNCSNFVRTLFEMDLHARPGMAPTLKDASAHLVAAVNRPEYAQGHASSQAISNLMSFVKLCDKRLQRAKAGEERFDQADLLRAAGVLYGQLMTHDAADFRGAEAIGGLLSSLCYLWRRGLVVASGAEHEWIAGLMRSIAGINAARWSDKSRKVMLPALQALIEMGAITLGSAQPALAVLLRGPGSASSGYTAADLAQAIKGLGVVEEAVIALPPEAMALPASAPAPVPATPPADLPRAIPGETKLIAAMPAASPQAASTVPAPAQRREAGKAAQSKWRTPAKVARNEPRHAPMPEVDASWPTWADTGMNTATSSTSTSTTTSSSTITSSTTSAARPAKKGAQAKHKPAPGATKARPQQPVQQWFALLTAKGSIDLKRLKELARNQPSLVNKNDESGRNALFHAIAGGDEKAVAWIIAHESYVAPAQTARFLKLLMDEVLLYSPAFGAALRCFLALQTAVVKEELQTHFARKPPVMKGVEDILAKLGLIESKQVAANDKPAAGFPQQSMPDALTGLGEQAIASQLRKAEKGSPHDQFELGYSFQHGVGVAADEEAAVRWYHLAARQGLAEAEYSLGDCYENGIGVARDEREAVRWYRKSAEQGFAAAQFALGICHEQGISVGKDEKEASRLFQQAAQQGNAGAENSLGYCYQHGIGVAKDEKEAIRWYRRSAGQGDANAQFNLGRCHEQGIGVTKSEKEAVSWYLKAAHQGLAAAETNLGNCYIHGTGVKKDEEEAVRWYRKAADQGFAIAENSLACCYQSGIGVAKDQKEAVLWFEKAALHGHAEAQYNLGVHYQYGEDRVRDEKAAVHWYRQAAEQGQPNAQYYLAICYYQGVGVAKDPQVSIGWLRKAAGQGYADAQELLKKLVAVLRPTDTRV